MKNRPLLLPVQSADIEFKTIEEAHHWLVRVCSPMPRLAPVTLLELASRKDVPNTTAVFIMRYDGCDGQRRAGIQLGDFVVVVDVMPPYVAGVAGHLTTLNNLRRYVLGARSRWGILPS